MTFQQLKYVMAVEKYGSINRAAEKLFVSQSSISCALSDLEKEFRIVLFNRSSGRTGSITEDGRYFLTYAKSILDRKDDLEEFYSNRNEASKTRLSVSSQHYQCVSAACIDYLNQLGDKGYQITYKECGMGNVIDDVYTFRADLGIIITSNLTENMANFYLNRRNLVFEAMTEIQPCVFLSKSHPLAGMRRLKVDDILAYPYATFAHNQDTPIDFSEGINSLSMQQNRQSIITNDRASMVNLLCNSNCVSTGSGLLLENISDPQLISIPLEDSMEHMVLGWVKSKNVPLSKESEHFLKILSSVLDRSQKYTSKIWNKDW